MTQLSQRGASSRDIAYNEMQRIRALSHYWRAAATVTTSPVDVFCIGDSETAGVQATVHGPGGTRYTDVLRDLLQARHPVSGVPGGEGYVYAGNLPGVPTRWEYTGAGIYLSNYGLGRTAYEFVGAPGTASIDVECTGIDILWTGSNATGVFSYAVDGGAATEVDTFKFLLNSAQITQIRGLAAGTHTLLLSRVSGSTVIDGIMVYNGDESAGVRIWPGGHNSFDSWDFTNLLTTAGKEWIHGIAPGSDQDNNSFGTIQPDLVLIALGTNDYYFGNGSAPTHTPAALKANLTTLVADIRLRCTGSPSIVFVVQPKRDDVTSIAYEWSEYSAAIYAAAKADPLRAVGVLDLDPRFWLSNIANPWTNPPGWINVDKVHPNDSGYALWAHAVADYLEPRP